MKFSRLYAPTTKEAPKDATLPSHQFLIRAGFIEQLGSGLYNLLPLGKMAYDNIAKVIKENMDKAGAQEVSFSFVTPATFWRESGRFDIFGKELLRIKDRKNNDFVLSPTNEESAVNMVKNRITSYKQLPLHLYQINTKFRDEARPRFGLLRGREFIMKDGYSFHADVDDLRREFLLMKETYSKIFKELGFKFKIVEADSGAIGGSGSNEFMVLANNGEDDIVVCTKCDYGANIETAKRAKREFSGEAPSYNMQSKFHTPGITTIDSLAKFFNVDKFFIIKAVIKKAIYQNKSEIVVFFVRGDDELQETKALNAINALELVDISDEEIAKAGLVAGYCGPLNLPDDIKFFIDSDLKESRGLICGANEEGYHLIGFNVINFKDERFADLSAVTTKDRCLKCGGKFEIKKGIEVGHIFMLGDKYSKAMNATFLDKNGKTTPYMMGCYGIGVSRLLAVAIEVGHDEKGCIWPKKIAPFKLVIINLNTKNEEQVKFSDELYEKCQELGIEVLYDDRDERVGVKMSEFELMGFPYAIVVGKKLKEGLVELIYRDGLIKKEIGKDEVLKFVKESLC